MCKPEQCPLSELCIQRVQIAKAVYSSELARINESMDSTVDQLDGRPKTIETPEDLVFVVDGLKAIASSFQNVSLGYEIDSERIEQTIEHMPCKGPIVTRQFGFIGRVPRRECASHERTQRLARHLERKPLPEGTAIENRIEE